MGGGDEQGQPPSTATSSPWPPGTAAPNLAEPEPRGGPAAPPAPPRSRKRGRGKASPTPRHGAAPSLPIPGLPQPEPPRPVPPTPAPRVPERGGLGTGDARGKGRHGRCSISRRLSLRALEVRQKMALGRKGEEEGEWGKEEMDLLG